MRQGRQRVLIASVVVSVVLFLSLVGAASAELSGPWEPTTSYPTGIYLHSCAIYSVYIYCVGGSTGSSVTAAVYYAEISSTGIVGSWTLTTSYPGSIYEHSCAIYSDYVYCVGGYTTTGPTTAVYYAEVSSSGVGSWTPTTSYPLGIYGHSCAIYSDYVYCVGGSTTGGPTAAVYYAEVSSTGVVGSWTLTTSYPTSINAHSCAIYLGYIYCVGGSTLSVSSATAAVYYAEVSSSGVGSWTPTTSYPTKIEATSCAIYSGHIYCVGGYYGSTVTYAVYYAAVSLSGVGTWTSTYSYPIDGYYHSCAIYSAVSSGYIYCVGGYDGGVTAAVYFAPIGPPTLSITTSATTPLAPGATSAKDTATLTGASNPTGTVTFTLYSDASCTTMVGSTASSAWTPNGGGSYSATGTVTYTFSTAGTYYWVASFAGDINNAGAGPTACGADGETLVVSPVAPSFSTSAITPLAPGATSAKDTATLTGASNPTGTVTFTLYSDASCTTMVGSTASSAWTPNGGGSYSATGTVTYTFSTAGTYYWVASFVGDANNAPAKTHCGDAGETLNVTTTVPEFPTGILALVIPVLAVYLLIRYGIGGRGKTLKPSPRRSAEK